MISHQKLRGAYFITGSSGSGKTSAINELKRLGYNAIDGDKVMGRFVDNDGNERWDVDVADPAWNKKYKWVFDPDILSQTINNSRHVFIGMITADQLEHYSKFKKVFYLDVDGNTAVKRASAPREHDFGNHHHNQKLIRDEIDSLRKMYSPGATLIDATKPLSVVVEEVLEHVQREHESNGAA